MTGVAQKLRSAGYRTVFTGKWDAGMATPTHTPAGRGYDSSLNYFHHANDYWSQSDPMGGGCKEKIGVDLYNTTEPAWGLNTSIKHHNYRNASAYEEAIFHRRLAAEIDQHDPSKQPLFVFYAAHLVHLPYQVPQDYLDRASKAGGGPFDNSTKQDAMRMIYHAMVQYLDDAVGRLVDQFKSKGMWENTLVWFMSDNGGPIYVGGNNYPLRGGKYSEFEGGVRVSAFFSGGVVPEARRGTRSEALGAAADLYTTLCSVAGVDPTDHVAAAAGLPPVDGVDLSGIVFGAGDVSTGPRTEVPLAPLSGGDLQSLDDYDEALAAYEARDAGRKWGRGTDWDVYENATCKNSNENKIAFLHNTTTLASCEAACAANSKCLQFQWKRIVRVGASHWCALFKTAGPAHITRHDDTYACGCRGTCPDAPGPSPGPGPGPKPPKIPKCYKVEQCTVLGSQPFKSKKNLNEGDCCDLCNAVNGTGPGKCAISVFFASSSQKKTGTCDLYSSSALSNRAVFHGANHSMCSLPSAVNPPPRPIMYGQAGIVVGNLKLVTGIQVAMTIFTGPQYPNSSTPYETEKVPYFDCSTPSKPYGCLFNLTADPTEHHDLALTRTEDALRLLRRLQNVSRTYFDPSRGTEDPRACVRMMGVNRGFFGPWLEMTDEPSS